MNQILNESKYLQWLIIIFLFIVVNLTTYFTQARINLNDGKGIDGAEYYEMAKIFSAEGKISGNAPLVYRIGTPLLAGITDGDDLIRGFFFVNLTANFLSCLLLFLFLKIYVKNFYIIIFLVLLYLLHPLCNTRYIYFCPVITDPWGLVFLLSGLILLEKIRKNNNIFFILLFSAVCFTGVLFREYILELSFALFFISNPLEKNSFLYLNFSRIFKYGVITLLPLAAGITGIGTAYLLASNNEPDYSFLKAAIYYFYEKSLFRYVYAWLLALGPVISILIFFYKDIFKFLNVNQHLLFLIVCTIVLSFAGGSDSARIILLFVPLILMLEGIIIGSNSWVFKKIFFIFPLILFQSISMKVFRQIPEPVQPESELGVQITPMLGGDYFLNLISPLEDLKFEFVSFLKYSFAIGFLLIVLRYYFFKTAK